MLLKILDFNLDQLQKIYTPGSGSQVELWQLIMGTQIHIGGMEQSLLMAARAGIKERAEEAHKTGKNLTILDVCSAYGSSLRLLVSHFPHVVGVGLDGTDYMVEKAKAATEQEGLTDKVRYILADVSCDFADIIDTPIDVVWGEDAWAYITNKENIIKNAAQILAPGGILAFSDWLEGEKGLSDDESERICKFMHFPYMESIKTYVNYIEKHGFKLIAVEDLNRDYADFMKMYIKMLTNQLTYDALQIIKKNENLQSLEEAMEVFKFLVREMQNMSEQATDHRLTRGHFIAVRL